MIDFKIVEEDGEENKCEPISEENQKIYEDYFSDIGYWRSATLEEFCDSLLNTDDGRTFEKYTFTGESLSEVMEKIWKSYRTLAAISVIKALSFYILLKTEISYDEILKNIDALTKRVDGYGEYDAIFFNANENPEQKEAFIVKIVFNYKLKN